MRREVLDIYHGMLYLPEQVLQLLDLHDAQLDLLVEGWNSGVLLFDDMAKTDMRRSTSESSHCGQETELALLLDRHSSSNSVSHFIQRNSYIGIRIHLTDSIRGKAHVFQPLATK